MNLEDRFAVVLHSVTSGQAGYEPWSGTMFMLTRGATASDCQD